MKRQYIGVTNEPLCEEGIKKINFAIENNKYKYPQLVFSSPLSRCIETSKLIYPEITPIIYEDLSECNFGDFEQKSYEDLKDNSDYIAWLNSNGTIAFPNGEDKNSFSIRCKTAFKEILDYSKAKAINDIAIICHGGTIMAILDEFSAPHKDFYDWQVSNSNGYSFLFDTDKNIATKIKLIFDL